MKTQLPKPQPAFALAVIGATIGSCVGFLAAQAATPPSAYLVDSVSTTLKAESWRLAQQANPPKPQAEVLQEGTTGANVKLLQQRLKQKGFDPGPIDSSFGLSTKTALIAFQKSQGLPADGIAGAKTLAVLGLKMPIAKQSANAGNPSGAKSTQVPKPSVTKSPAIKTATAATPAPTTATATQKPAVVADRLYWPGSKGNLGLSITGKFNSTEKMVETFDLGKLVGIFNGKQWKLSDILVSIDFNASGSAANWKVSGPKPIVERYLASLKSGYQDKSLLYDFGFSEVDFKPTAAFEGARKP
ncbi:MAG TPA: peptidoglycan-binding domain-containing protein [Candidatus Caenarcaniphilales bacterium]